MHERAADRVNLALNWAAVALALVLPLSRTLVVVASSLVIVLWIVERDWRTKARTLLASGPSRAALLFVAVSLVSLLWSQHPVAGLDYVSKYRYLLLVPALVTSLRPSFRDLVETALLCGVGASLVWSYAIFLGWVRVGKGYPEHAAPTMNHLDYSIFLALAGLLTLLRLVHAAPTTRRRLGYALLLALIVGGLAINIGRSGQLAFFASLLVVLPACLRGRPLRRLALSTAAVVLLAAGLYVAVPTFGARSTAAVAELRAAIVDHDYASNQGKRVATIIVAATIVGQHPLLGVGAGDAKPELDRLLGSRFARFRPVLASVPHFHNQYLQTAVEVGLVGIAALLYLFSSLLLLKPLGVHDWGRALALASVFLVGFVGDPFLHKQLPLALFATVLGLVAAAAARPAPATATSPKETRTAR